jgi:hypothetical protein
MNNDNWPEWRDMSPRWRILIVALWLALSLCSLPSHRAGSFCLARLWDFCCYLRDLGGVDRGSRFPAGDLKAALTAPSLL